MSPLVSQGAQRDSRTSLILQQQKIPQHSKPLWFDIPCPSLLQPTKAPKSKEIEDLEVSKAKRINLNFALDLFV